MLLEQREGVLSPLQSSSPSNWCHQGEGVGHGHAGNYDNLSCVSFHHPLRCDTLPPAARSAGWVDGEDPRLSVMIAMKRMA